VDVNGDGLGGQLTKFRPAPSHFDTLLIGDGEAPLVQIDPRCGPGRQDWEVICHVLAGRNSLGWRLGLPSSSKSRGDEAQVPSHSGQNGVFIVVS
jgi:hypothetical protein